MEPEITDAPEVLETPADPEPTPEPETLTPEAIEELKAKAAKADELEAKNKQLFERAKKAEEKKPEPTEGLTAKDALTLAKADIHEDDIEDVLSWAKFKNIPVADALKDPTMKTTLSIRAEERRSALATQTGSGRGAQKVAGEDLLRKAELTGEVPDTAEGMNAIFEARQARRFPKR